MNGSTHPPLANSLPQKQNLTENVMGPGAHVFEESSRWCQIISRNAAKPDSPGRSPGNRMANKPEGPTGRYVPALESGQPC